MDKRASVCPVNLLKVHFKNIYLNSQDIYGLDGFEPVIVDKDYLRGLGVSIEPSEETLRSLREGSEVFARRFDGHTLVPEPEVSIEDCDPETIVPEIHNYTGRCPALTFEINPVKGCNVGCQYCLVTDGAHVQDLVAYGNYHLYVRRLLNEKNGRGSENRNHYYYFSPKTEALQEPTLLTGIAHRILREFVAHFQEFPESNARLFIASKAGAGHLLIKDEGENILDLFTELKGRMQFNTSVSIMPSAFRSVLEPNAAPIEERLKAVRMCRESGIPADSALVQPIFTPYLTESRIKEFFDTLGDSGIINYKPEFLTVCVENLAMLGQLLGHFDKSLERQLYEDYLTPSNTDHRKQRGRTAPDRRLSTAMISRMMEYTGTIGMSTSICYWVRKQLGITEEMIPPINRNGFQCLGYQSHLFSDGK